MLYSVAVRFSKKASRRYKILLVVISILGLLLGFVPFGQLLSWLYPFFAWLGLVIMACVFYRTVIKKKKAIAEKEQE